MDEVKVYVVENRNVCIICRNCGMEHSIELSDCMSSNTIAIECKCHNKISAFVDRRKFYRKPVELTGICYAPGDPEEGVLVKIFNISRTGMGFIKCGGKSLAKNELITIKFRLHASTNPITIRTSVINIYASDNIGTNIMELDQHTQKLLGFFLLP